MGNTFAITQEMASVRQELRQQFQLLRQEMASGFELMDHKIDRLRSDLSRELIAHRQSIVVRLGSLIVACFGLTLAALRYGI